MMGMLGLRGWVAWVRWVVWIGRHISLWSLAVAVRWRRRVRVHIRRYVSLLEMSVSG